MESREGAFARYEGEDVRLVGYTTCDGCPGGNVEYAPAEMAANGADVIHLATGLVVGYPPCPYLADFERFIPAKFGLEVVVGTHPIPTSYYDTHTALGTWEGPEWQRWLEPTVGDAARRQRYS